MSQLLNGIIPPVITPLTAENELDEKGTEQLLENLIKGGVHGIFLLGTTGEATNLSYPLRKHFIEKACSVVNKRVPVIVGITDTSIAGSFEIAEVSKNAGADALVISAPYYLPISQHEFVTYLEYLVPKLPLPFLLYNMPGCTKMHFSPETVQSAKELGALGIKDSSGDLAYFYELTDKFKNSKGFTLLCGTELFLPESVTYGGNGGVPGGANIFPKVFVDLYNAALVGNSKEILRLREIVIQIEKKIYNIGIDSSKYIKGIKCALSILGVCEGYVAQPFSMYGEKEYGEMKQNLDELFEMYPELKQEINTN